MDNVERIRLERARVIERLEKLPVSTLAAAVWAAAFDAGHSATNDMTDEQIAQIDEAFIEEEEINAKS